MAVKTGRIRRAFTFTRSDLRSYAMLAPYLFFYALTILVPLVITVALSFTTYNMFQMPKWAGLDNFIRIFIADDVFLKAFTNTILFAVFTGPLSFLLCFFVAWVINDLPRAARAGDAGVLCAVDFGHRLCDVELHLLARCQWHRERLADGAGDPG